MAKTCEICGKGAVSAGSIVYRGKAKKKGGVGKKVTGLSKRYQKPNLHKVKAIIDGQKKRITICSKCLKAGKVERAY